MTHEETAMNRTDAIAGVLTVWAELRLSQAKTLADSVPAAMRVGRASLAETGPPRPTGISRWNRERSTTATIHATVWPPVRIGDHSALFEKWLEVSSPYSPHMHSRKSSSVLSRSAKPQAVRRQRSNFNESEPDRTCCASESIEGNPSNLRQPLALSSRCRCHCRCHGHFHGHFRSRCRCRSHYHFHCHYRVLSSGGQACER
jgi:hypothetical protein